MILPSAATRLADLDRQIASAQPHLAGCENPDERARRLALLEAERKRILGPVGVEADFIRTIFPDFERQLVAYEAACELIDETPDPDARWLKARADAVEQVAAIAYHLRQSFERLRVVARAERDAGLPLRVALVKSVELAAAE